MAREEKHSVERLKRQLYARDGVTETGEERTPLSSGGAQAPVSWDGVRAPSSSEMVVPQPDAAPEPEPKSTEQPTPMSKLKSPSLAAKFLTGSFVFFILATGAAAYMFFGGANLISPQNIDIEIIAPSLVDGGKEAALEVLIRNRNQTALETVDLIIEYPDGARSPNNSTQELTYERHSIGTISPGEQIKRSVSAIFYGSEGVEQKIKMTLEYNIAGSNAIFEKEAEATFTVGSSPVSLSVSAPDEITSGDQFTMELEVRSNAVSPIVDVVVQAQYPFGFEVRGVSPKAEAGSTFWRLGTMEPGSTEKIRITGLLSGQDGDERVFRFMTGSVSDDTQTQIAVPFLVVPESLTINAPFISGTISVEGKTGRTISVSPGAKVQGTVTWVNNLSEPVSNVELTLGFSGPALEEGSIDATNGFFQSSSNSIIWTGEEESSLRVVPPGERGSAQFSFATLPPGSGNVLITNPTIDLTLNVRGVRGVEGGSPQNVSSVATTRVTLASTPSITAEALHFSGPFSNSGPMPPRAESDTTYTIIWTARNPSNEIANATISTTLPPYVEFVTAQGGTGITFDEGSRRVRWNMGDLRAGAGYTLPARQAAFQVRLSPSTSQVGEVPRLTGDADFSGQDRFAQVSVEAEADALTTNLFADDDFEGGMDIVQDR